MHGTSDSGSGRGLLLAGTLLLASCSGSAARQAPTAPATAATPVAQAIQASQQSAPPTIGALHEPLLEGQALLHHGLRAAAASVQVLRWRDGRLRASNEPLTIGLLHDNSSVVLWRLNDDGIAEQDRWYLFEPAHIRLRPLPFILHDDGSLSATVVRVLPQAIRNGADPGDGIFAAELICNEGRIRPDVSRLVSAPGGRASSAMLLANGRVAFLHRSLPGARQRLILAPLDGSSPAIDPLPAISGDIQGLERSSDHRLRFAANPRGWYQPYTLDLEDMRLEAGSGSIPPPRTADRLLIAAKLEHGTLTPQVLRLPDELDLDTLLALCAAHNPQVNRDRALLAVALADSSGLDPAARQPGFGAALASDDANAQILVESIGRGLASVLPELLARHDQPIDIRQRLRISQAQSAVEQTLNTKQAALCESWFQCRTMQEVLRVDDALIGVLESHHQAMQARHRAGTVVASDVLAVAKALDDAKRQRQRHSDSVAFHLDAIRRLCALPPEYDLQLHNSGYRFDRLPAQNPRDLHELALLNNPRLQAARLNLGHGFTTLPSKGLPVQVDQTTGETAWDDMLRALQHQQHDDNDRIGEAVAANLERYRETRRAWAVQRQHVAWALEQVRLARLYEQYPLVDTDQKRRSQGLQIERARYYRQLAEQLRQEADLGTSFTQLWRAVGSIEALNHHLNAVADERIAKSFPSLWLWDSRHILSDRAAMDAFIERATALDVKQVYCYLPAGDNPLDDRLLAERLTMMINRCATQHISVWALLGEDAWLQGGGKDYFQRSLDGVVDYNRRFGAFEPRLAGIKFGLRLERNQAWSGAVAEQSDIAARWIDLVRQARSSLPPDMPLWVDCPAGLFDPINRHLAEELLTLTDGLSVLCGGRDRTWIRETADRILADWPGLLEIGIELEPNVDPAMISALGQELIMAHREHPGFTGIAFHDWTGLATGDDQ